MENVAQFSHLGHIVTARVDDAEDIHHRRCNLIGQINSVVCYFHGLDSAVKVRLIKAYCLSLNSCELWDLCNSQIETICVAFCKGLRRCLDIPYYSDSFLLPGLTDTLPLFHEISKRSTRFLYKYMLSPSSSIRSVVLHSVLDIGCNSVFSSNIYSTCKLFGLSSGDLLNNKFWLAMTVTEKEHMYVELARELICLHDGYLSLSNGFVIPREHFQTILNCVTVDTVYFV